MDFKDLKEKAGFALNIPKLVEIVENAPLTKEGKVNLSAARAQAYRHVVEETHDLKDAKKLADSARALAMLRRDYEKEFTLIVAYVTEAQEAREEKTTTGKNQLKLMALEDMKFELPSRIMLTTKEWDAGPRRQHFIGFHSYRNGGTSGIIEFCTGIIKGVLEASDVDWSVKVRFLEKFIELLKTKGLMFDFKCLVELSDMKGSAERAQ